MAKWRPMPVLMLALIAQPASAIDFGKALKRPVTAHFTSSKNIYDLERCIVLLDGPGVPVVYRQPDRPDEEMIAYANGGLAVTNVIMLKRASDVTTIEMHEIKSGLLAKAPSALAGCL